MFANRRFYAVSAMCAVTAATFAISSSGSAQQRGDVPQLAYDLSYDQPATIHPVAAPRPAPAEGEVECMSKVVRHEASNQPRRGQLAVAQALVNRLHAGRFGETICQVVGQPGQFFDVTAYQPRRDTAEWQTAVEVSRQALDGSADQVAPGALFFRAAYAPSNTFFRTRQRVAAIGGHIFYR